MRPSLKFILFLISWSVMELRSASGDEASEFFERRVRPLLVANCYACHGPKKQESNLRLDSRQAILEGGDSGQVIQVGQPDHSRLIEAIRWTGELKMPPASRLKDDEIEVLTKWIAMGLPWPEAASRPAENDVVKSHWAFQPVRRPNLPEVAHVIWPRTSVDRFLLAEMEKQGLAPAKEAERRTLLRRAFIDLIGLPPTPDEVESFVHDPAEDAYERMLDRVLASPGYGERWGRHWLDVARYADTKGYVFFEDKAYPWAYTYRDYVIRSLNADLPYDRFVLEQLAADQLELGDDKLPLTALGFLTTGSHFMNNTHDIIDDRIDVVSRGLMGLTVTCARCHDHKYDPLTMADYYGMYGVFRSCVEPMVPPLFTVPADTEENRKFAAEMTLREKKLTDFVTQKHAELVQDARTRISDYLLAAYNLRDHPPTDDFMLLVDKGDLNPTMILRWQVYLAQRKSRTDPVFAPWHALADLPTDSFAQQSAQALDSVVAHSGESRTVNRLVRDVLQRAPLGSMKDVAQRYGELLSSVNQQWQELQKTAAAGQPTRQSLDDTAAEELRQVLYGRNSPPDVPLAMDWGFLSLFPDRPTQGEYQKLLKELEQWMMTGPGAPPRAMVLLDDARPHDPHIFLRGNPHRLGPQVPRRFPTLLNHDNHAFQNGSGRKELAEAIIDPANPLTARVIVNRVWMHHFGWGLVATSSDFGLRSEPPSHPELLDWLASQLIAHGWSLKWLHREIMLSAAYRQDSKTVESAGSDPDNRWLARFPRRRLEFEAMRDSMLAVADSLDRRAGGPAVNLLGDAVVPRRTIYGNIDRMDVPTLLTTFDFPDPLTTNPQRSATTVAPQSLYAMNNGFVTEISRRLLLRPDVEYGNTREQRILRLYDLCLGRPPDREELDLAQEFLGTQPDEAKWNRFGQALLITNEFMFVD